MKRLCSLVLICTLLFLFLSACSNETETDSPEHATTPTEPAPTELTVQTEPRMPEPTTAPVTWSNYTAVGLANVLRVSYAEEKQEENQIWNSYLSCDYPSEKTVGICADIQCPYCHEEASAVYLFSKIPSAQLGSPVVTISDEVMCLNWDNHADSFYSNYTYSVMLTLSTGAVFPSPEVTVPETESTQTPDPVPSVEPAPTEPPTSDVPHLETVHRADQSIFDGPGYDYSFVGTVELAGVYTIMEEVWDYEGNLWGRLKSGIGWIDLTDVRNSKNLQIPITANYADDTLLDSGNFHHCIADTSEYMVQVAFRANAVLTDVTFSSLQFSESGYEIAQVLCTLPELSPEKPLVADISFPGDLSAFGISFTVDGGSVYNYMICISGRNGALELTTWDP